MLIEFDDEASQNFICVPGTTSTVSTKLNETLSGGTVRNYYNKPIIAVCAS